jgi:hypothetical protein
MIEHISKIDIDRVLSGFSYAESRWARLGPYYAMFPMEFAYKVILRHSKQGDFVLDPFAGRGSGTFAAAALERKTHGIEINPVGWLYGTVKLCPAPKKDVLRRLNEIHEISSQYREEASSMGEFYNSCFSPNVLCFLLAARKKLNWKANNIDSTLMALILHYLHGKRGSSLSNQMPMAKSTSIQYSIDWWKRKGYSIPPDIDILAYFNSRITWRYDKGRVDYSDRGRVVLSDSTTELKLLHNKYTESNTKIDLLFTSPPYYGVTNYHVDQWLRLWLLGGPDKPTVLSEKHKGRFNSMPDYEYLLDIVFGECAKILSNKGVIYVRTDYRKFTLETTKKTLKKHFPDHRMSERFDYSTSKSQTELLNNTVKKVCEVDLLLLP